MISNRNALRACTALALAALAPLAAHAATIDFAALPANANNAVNPTVGGLTFSNPQQYVVGSAYGPSGNSANLLTGILSNNPADDRFLDITSASSQPFSLYSFVAAESTCCSSDNTVVVTGHFVGGATQQLTFSNLSTTQWQTEQLDWTGLTSVEIHSGASFGGYGDFLSFQTTAPTAPVPEPAMATLLLAGLGVLAAKSRRKSA